jgi:oxalate decarboxylase
MAAAAAALSTAAAAKTFDPGPENVPLTQQQPDAFYPPSTDHGSAPSFWSSYSLMHRRIQECGWVRQVNSFDFPISQDIAGVNMALGPGVIRELHWHVQDEWAIMLSGNCRLTAFDYDGHPWVQNVKKGDLWYFPAGVPHSLQGMGPGGCEFLLVFDDGAFSDEDTTLITDWVKHTPTEVLAKNWGVPTEAFAADIARIPSAGKYIFGASEPQALAQARAEVTRNTAFSSTDFSFKMLDMKPQKSTKSGNARIVDSTNFKVAKNIALAYVVVHPGGLRELHWHPDANEWQYYIQGKGRMTVYFNNSVARTADFNPNDVGYVPKTLPHYIENTGDTDLIYLEIFKTDRFRDFSLNDWMTHLPTQTIMETLNIDEKILDAIPRKNFAVLPA